MNVLAGDERIAGRKNEVGVFMPLALPLLSYCGVGYTAVLKDIPPLGENFLDSCLL